MLRFIKIREEEAIAHHVRESLGLIRCDDDLRPDAPAGLEE
jgi:hypothetical protein